MISRTAYGRSKRRIATQERAGEVRQVHILLVPEYAPARRPADLMLHTCAARNLLIRGSSFSGILFSHPKNSAHWRLLGNTAGHILSGAELSEDEMKLVIAQDAKAIPEFWRDKYEVSTSLFEAFSPLSRALPHAMCPCSRLACAAIRTAPLACDFPTKPPVA